ncbi:WRKY transcription factor 19 [Phytophthora cinnamomi]|uniref:WRKY transcription factor 19 n=1 Tax=Phytophthora cinnamomi TaxID=4785 RepID=UPI0035594F01|nr:WRKY transcription factor 19 [Phytophthora cinnamomi]
MLYTTVQIAVVAAAFVQTASAYSSYMELIPNGENIGKSLGHTATGYTEFGQLFSDDGTEWSKVCSKTWPGGSVTCGEALGDPCCTWKSGNPDYTLSEPNTDGTTCASSSTATSTAAASTTSSAAQGETTTPTSGSTTATSGSTTNDSATQQAASSNTTDSTAVTDSSEYCE